MDFDSPEVMKDFPGLYASELNKKCSNDSDYSDETEKALKKDILIGKRKDKKDKDRGYEALEGESSDENCKSSPSKSKKSKSFKFTKSKEKREKSREKETTDKKKERDRKIDKKSEKEKGKKIKQPIEDAVGIADALPIFGVSLKLAVERSRCHDGVDIPLPIRECIDYTEANGIAFEGVYKIGGIKAKVSQIKKMYNSREHVNLSDYEIPTVTSLLKHFLRDLPEPIFTDDLLIRFEEAGAILNLSTREKHLKILVDNLPSCNKLLLSWLVIHLHNISLNEKQNKMSKQHIAAALNHTFRVSSRLLQALLHHGTSLFPKVVIFKYIPPLSSSAQLPDEGYLMETELNKQESLLSQIHTEMNCGFVFKEREELLWEVQRIVTQLKRKLKTLQKDKEISDRTEEKVDHKENVEETVNNIEASALASATTEIAQLSIQPVSKEIEVKGSPDVPDKPVQESNDYLFDDDIVFLTYKRNGLMALQEQLLRGIKAMRKEISILKVKLESLESADESNNPLQAGPKQECLSKVMTLLNKENQILQIKKINLVRQIIEQKESCIELSAQIKLTTPVASSLAVN